jgi:ligand-binding sensor domain-containing protein
MIKMIYKNVLCQAGLAICMIFSLISCENDEPNTTEEAPFETVTGFVINENGEKLLATEKGLYVLNENSAKFEIVKTEIEIAPLNDLALSNSTVKEELWLASNSGVLNLTNQLHLTNTNSGLKSNTVSHISFDNNDRSYFASPMGVSIFDSKNWFATSGQNDLYLNFEITDMASAVNGFTYITTHGGGIERLKMDVDGISGATVFDTDWTKLESNNINTVYIDSITQVYGTDAGVAMHFSEYTKWDWETYSTKDGLINDTVTAVLKDKSNNWWFGTKHGLSSFNNSKWTNYTLETHDFISNNVKFLALDIDGTIWIATDDGLSHFTGGHWINYSK